MKNDVIDVDSHVDSLASYGENITFDDFSSQILHMILSCLSYVII